MFCYKETLFEEMEKLNVLFAFQRESSVSIFYECQTFGGTVSFLSFPLIV